MDAFGLNQGFKLSFLTLIVPILCLILFHGLPCLSLYVCVVDNVAWCSPDFNMTLWVLFHFNFVWFVLRIRVLTCSHCLLQVTERILFWMLVLWHVNILFCRIFLDYTAWMPFSFQEVTRFKHCYGSSLCFKCNFIIDIGLFRFFGLCS